MRLGEYDRSNKNDGQHQDINVEDIIQHEVFPLNRKNRGKYPRSDIAILRLEHDVDFTTTGWLNI